MKKISQMFYGKNSQLFGNPNATFQWYLFGYRQNGAVLIYLWSKPSWLARFCCRAMLGSHFFEVEFDPSFSLDKIDPSNDLKHLSIVEDSNTSIKPH